MIKSRLPFAQHRGIGPKTHRGSVLALAVTEDGTLLASGGSRGTQVWNTANMKLHTCLTTFYTPVHKAAIWCQQDGKPLQYSFPDPEINAMAFDSTNNRLCLCTRDDTVQSWSIKKDGLTGKRVLENIFSIKLPRFAPQAIAFAAYDNGVNRDILVLGLHNSGPMEDGRGVVVGSENMEVLTPRCLVETPLSTGKRVFFCVDDPASGPALFRISNHIKSRTYEIDRERPNQRIRKVHFGDHGSTIVCGSDHGCVYVCDTRSGKVLETLSVGSSEWVQVVTTAEIDGVPVIFAAQMGALDHPEEIFSGSEPDTGASGCMAFVCQNLQAAIKVIGKAELGGEEMTESLPVVGKAEFGGEQGSQVV
ncbi:WD40-repeat-containing domain protein [Mycena crocata]|nr:WD40-repeat-containing domain protein [Mycena crocata]